LKGIAIHPEYPKVSVITEGVRHEVGNEVIADIKNLKKKITGKGIRLNHVNVIGVEVQDLQMLESRGDVGNVSDPVVIEQEMG